MDADDGGQFSHGSQSSGQGAGRGFGQSQSVGYGPGLGQSQNGLGQSQNAGTGQGAGANGNLSSAEQQRLTAARIARKRVLAAYEHKDSGTAGTVGFVGTMGVSGTSQGAIYSRGDSYNGGNSRNASTVINPASASANANAMAKGGTHLKSQPIASKANSEDWRKYHSAWQNYYQKYYSEYYASAARNYVEKERLKDARKQAEDEETLNAIGKMGGRKGRKNAMEAQGSALGAPATSGEEAGDVGAKLKQTIRKKAVKDVKKSRRRRRWIPVMLGVFVVLFILFMQYNRLIFAPIFAYMSPGEAPATQIEAIDPTVTQAVSAEPRLIIPKLNIDVPIKFGLQVSDVMAAMNSGVAHYRIAGASAYPGEVGNTVITGHSAGDIYSSNPYKYIFSGLERLEEGDLIYVNYESVRYTYQVSRKEVVEPSNVAALVVDTDHPMLTLVTCTPLGTSRYRLLVFADQIAPNAEGTETSEEVTVDVQSENEDNALPANEPSFFENAWNFLTGK